jgi:hypothetical protein
MIAMKDYQHICAKTGLFFAQGDPVRQTTTGRLGTVAPARTDKHDMVHVIDDHTGSERNWSPLEIEHI